MDQELAESRARLARRAVLEQAMVKRAICECEELEGFDAMEVARAFLAIAFDYVERAGPESAVPYLRYLKTSRQSLITALNAHADQCATAYDAEKAANRAKEDAWRN
jgi:hypothetical protein